MACRSMDRHGDNHHAPARDQSAPRGGWQQQQRLRASPVDGSGEQRVEDIHGDWNVAVLPAGIAVANRVSAPARNAPAGSEPVAAASQGIAADPAAVLVVMTGDGPSMLARLLPVSALEHPSPPRHRLDNAPAVGRGAVYSSDSGDDGLWPKPMRLDRGIDNANKSSNISNIDDGGNRKEDHKDDDNCDENPNAAVPTDVAAGASRLIPPLPPPVLTSNSQNTHGKQVLLGTVLSGLGSPLSPPRGGRVAPHEAAEGDPRADNELDKSTTQNQLSSMDGNRTKRVKGGFSGSRRSSFSGVNERRRTQNRIAQRTFREKQRERLNRLNHEIGKLEQEIYGLEKENAEIERENLTLKLCLQHSGWALPRDLFG